jgi:hypothetical protein
MLKNYICYTLKSDTMSHTTLSGSGLMERTQTRRSQLMTLWVTRQGQEFITTNDLSLCDVELITATCELVGEPQTGNIGTGTSSSNRIFTNKLLHNLPGEVSKVYDQDIDNSIDTRTGINHGQVNVQILGMTEGHQFRQDAVHLDNKLEFVVPTDLGLEANRIGMQSWPPQPIRIEAVKLQQRLRVYTNFLGNISRDKRVSRFVEDWADATGKRNANGQPTWFTGSDTEKNTGVIGSSEICQVPGNCITALKLVFNIKPRAVL